MVQMKQGQEYKRRDGAKVTQIAAVQKFSGPAWCGSDGVFRFAGGKTITDSLPHDIIAEWPSEPEGKTLAALDAQVGDVVRNDASGTQVLGDPFGTGFRYANTDGDSLGTVTRWHLVSRASDKDTAEDKPKTWGDVMPDECRAAWLLAAYRNKVESKGYGDQGWQPAGDPMFWGDGLQVRIRKEPVKGTVTRYGGMGPDGEWAFGDERSESDTHKQTFDTIDGKPDCASIKMAAFGIEVSHE